MIRCPLVADGSPSCISNCKDFGYEDERLLLMSQKSLEKRFGHSQVFIASTFMELGGIRQSTNPAVLLKEAIHVINCGYKAKTYGQRVELFYCHSICNLDIQS